MKAKTLLAASLFTGACATPLVDEHGRPACGNIGQHGHVIVMPFLGSMVVGTLLVTGLVLLEEPPAPPPPPPAPPPPPELLKPLVDDDGRPACGNIPSKSASSRRGC